jgi:DnaJ-domain-containing protein 1
MAVVAAEDEGQGKQPATPEQQYKALLKTYNDAFQEYAKAYREAKTPEDPKRLAFRQIDAAR